MGDYHGAGVSIDGGFHNGAVGNDIHHTGSHGVSIDGGDRKTLKSAENYADNNYIHHPLPSLPLPYPPPPFLPSPLVANAYFWANWPNEVKVAHAWEPCESSFKIPAPGEPGYHRQMKKFRVRIDFAETAGELLVDDVSLREVETADEWATWQAMGFDRRIAGGRSEVRRRRS